MLYHSFGRNLEAYRKPIIMYVPYFIRSELQDTLGKVVPWKLTYIPYSVQRGPFGIARPYSYAEPNERAASRILNRD